MNYMDGIWDNGPSTSFKKNFRRWAKSHNGAVQEGARTALFCELPSTDTRSRVRIGVYEADGRKMLRLDSVREELEVKLVERYMISEHTFTVASEKGSRKFEYNAETGEWSLEKRPV